MFGTSNMFFLARNNPELARGMSKYRKTATVLSPMAVIAKHHLKSARSARTRASNKVFRANEDIEKWEKVLLHALQGDGLSVEVDGPSVEVDGPSVQVDVQTDVQVEDLPVQVDAQPVQVDVQPVQVDVQPVQVDVQPVQVDGLPVEVDVKPDSEVIIENTADDMSLDEMSVDASLRVLAETWPGSMKPIEKTTENMSVGVVLYGCAYSDSDDDSDEKSTNGTMTQSV
jgi:hypothetical protein